ncbi:MAG: hypothetical protein KAI97_08775 [Gemmatimonadetes bacterium]|nr:hypothetical protein [Gemmatimonadota bacterium]
MPMWANARDPGGDTKPRTADDVCKYTWIPFVIFILLFGLYIVFVLGISMISEAGGF